MYKTFSAFAFQLLKLKIEYEWIKFIRRQRMNDEWIKFIHQTINTAITSLQEK